MQNLNKCVSEMDILHSGYLRRMDTREPLHLYTLRDYGLIECRKTGFSLSVTSTTIVENKTDLTIVITNANNYSVMLRADTPTEYLKWSSALSVVTVSSDFRVVRDIVGKGENSTVFRGERKSDGVAVAVKAVSKKNRPTASLVESYISKFLSRAARESYPVGLVRCLATYHTKNETHSVMEAVGPNLDTWLRRNGPMCENSAKRVTEQLFSAIDFLHLRDVVHCGVTAENVLLAGSDNGKLNVRLGGFSRACIRVKDKWEPRREYQDLMRGMQGVYVAPELLVEGKAGPAADFWSLGVLLYRALVGRLPFWVEGSTEMEAEERLREYSAMNRTDVRRETLFPTNNPSTSRLSPDARSCLASLLTPSPEERMSSRSITRHPWLLLDRTPLKGRNGSDSPVDVFSRGILR